MIDRRSGIDRRTNQRFSVNIDIEWEALAGKAKRYHQRHQSFLGVLCLVRARLKMVIMSKFGFR